jgi:hypothetical protein
MCFIGHGAFGFITKAVWCNYFGVFGIDESMAYQLMPIVGFVDVSLGIILLVYPLRIAAVWLVFWGLFTALLRPLSGEPFAEFLERAGNYGAPVILLLLSADLRKKNWDWFDRLIPVKEINENRLLVIRRWLQVFGFLLLLGHGWLNLIDKQGLFNQYSSIGFEHPSTIATIIGALECVGALLILVWPSRNIILILVIWKLASEVLYPSYPLLEWIERGGSYAVLLALWILPRSHHASTSLISYFAPGKTSRNRSNHFLP